jgi:pimeloyl-ACP methyl ester carboxylesterase
MPAVFVHGNPETPAIWGPLLKVLSRTDVVTLHLPGFGIPAPTGFGATRDDYVAWMINELEGIDGPIDLVGHDWGGVLVARVACLRPDLLRSWVCDVTGLLHPDYIWHDFAQIWQTPGAGEQYWADTLATPAQNRVDLFVAIGMTPDIAAELVAASDEEMARCVLALYRSAIQPAMVEWGAEAQAATARPGMAMINTADPFVNHQSLGEEMGRRMGAHVEIMQDIGHWWMMQDAQHGAEVLERFWSTL